MPTEAVGVDIRMYGAYTGLADNTAAINAAIADLPPGGGTLLVPGVFNFTGTLDFDGTQAIVVQGLGGISGGATPASALVYTGTGSGRAVSARSSFGLTIRDCAVMYTSSSFTGTLIDLSHSAAAMDTQHALIENALIGSGGASLQSAALLLDLDKTISSLFCNVNFSGADVAVRGRATGGSYSNVIRFDRCGFHYLKTVEAKNAGQAWTFDTCTFEQLHPAGASGGAGAYTSDFTANGLTFTGCWFGDANSTGTWINFSGTGLVVTGCYISSGQKGIVLPTATQTTAVCIVGNNFVGITGAGSAGVDVGSNNLYVDVFANGFNDVTNRIVYGALRPLASRIHAPPTSEIEHSGNLHLNNPAGQPVVWMHERLDPGNAPADSVFLFLRDNGVGKTQLCARFPTGALQVISTEPPI